MPPARRPRDGSSDLTTRQITRAPKSSRSEAPSPRTPVVARPGDASPAPRATAGGGGGGYLSRSCHCTVASTALRLAALVPDSVLPGLEVGRDDLPSLVGLGGTGVVDLDLDRVLDAVGILAVGEVGRHLRHVERPAGSLDQVEELRVGAGFIHDANHGRSVTSQPPCAQRGRSVGEDRPSSSSGAPTCLGSALAVMTSPASLPVPGPDRELTPSVRRVAVGGRRGPPRRRGVGDDPRPGRRPRARGG